MKKGRFIPIGTYNNVKIGYGTIDSKNLKSIYIQLNSWLQPVIEESNFNKIITKTRRNIKDYFYNMDLSYFKKETIVDLDVKTKGIKENKRSFMDLEITLFVDEQFEFKSKIIKNIIENISIEIIDEKLTENSLFNFHERKITP
jgi:hypothetical protein